MLVYVLAQGTSACTDRDRDLLLMYESTDFPFILPSEFLTFQDTILFLYLFPYSFFFLFAMVLETQSIYRRWQSRRSWALDSSIALTESKWYCWYRGVMWRWLRQFWWFLCGRRWWYRFFLSKCLQPFTGLYSLCVWVFRHQILYH